MVKGKGNQVDKGKGTNGLFHKGYTKGEKGEKGAKGAKGAQANGFWVWVETVPYGPHVNSIPMSFEEGEESEFDDDDHFEDFSSTGVWAPYTGDTGGAHDASIPVVEVSDDEHVTPAKRAREPEEPGPDYFVSYWR